MSTNNSDGKDIFSSFMKAFKEAKDKKEDDNAPLLEKITEGFVEGVAESVVHPFRWFRSVAKKG